MITLSKNFKKQEILKLKYLKVIGRFVQTKINSGLILFYSNAVVNATVLLLLSSAIAKLTIPIFQYRDHKC